MKTITALSVFLLILTVPLSGQDNQSAPPVAQEQLDLFLGDWQGNGMYESEDNDLRFDMSFSGTHIIEGKAIELNPRANIPEMGTYVEKSMLAWDPLLKQISMLTVSNMGEVGYYTGDWIVGKKNTLSLSQTKIVDNDSWKTETTIFFHDGNKMTWKSLSTKNDKIEGTFEATLTRQ